MQILEIYANLCKINRFFRIFSKSIFSKILIFIEFFRKISNLSKNIKSIIFYRKISKKIKKNYLFFYLFLLYNQFMCKICKFVWHVPPCSFRHFVIGYCLFFASFVNGFKTSAKVVLVVYRNMHE